MFHIPLDLIGEYAPPHPSRLKVDPTDPDSVLRAAGILDRHGYWDRALELYRLAVELLRGQEDELYAQNCIREVQGKIERSQGGR
jgi:hypothetical protein